MTAHHVDRLRHGQIPHSDTNTGGLAEQDRSVSRKVKYGVGSNPISVRCLGTIMPLSGNSR
jgi:hypothetical protein